VKNKVTLAGFLLTFTGAVLFSTKAIIVKKAFVDIKTDALSLLLLRMVCALPFYLATLFFTGKQTSYQPLSKKEWLWLVILGLFGYYISSFLDFAGLQYVSAGLERLILFLYPTFVVLINLLLFKQAISRVQLFALLLTYAGIAIAFWGEWQADFSNPDFVYGSILIFFCSITYAVYLVGGGKLIPKMGGTRFTAYSMIVSTAGVMLHYLLSGKSLSFQSSTAVIWGYGMLLAIVATVIPSFLLAAGMKRVGSSNSAIISSVGPVSTIIQAHYILGEKMLPAQVIGTLLVIAGVLLIGKKESKG
jgi:drug/metabolite transporter (DMT)-like permease